MKKLTILALHLGYGGVEKSIVALANMLSDTYDVEIISSYKLYDASVFPINKKVKINYLITKYRPNQQEWKNAIKKLRLIKFLKETYNGIMTLFLRRYTMIQAIKNSDADIIVSTRSLFNTWLGYYGRGKALKIGWEHNHYHGDLNYAKQIIKSARDLNYLVLVSDSLRAFYKKPLKPYKCKCVYIPNIIDEIPDKTSSLTKNKIISIGRLSREKGYEDLLDVMKLVNDKEPNWTLDIIGDGAQKNLLGDRIFEKEMSGYIKLHGYQKKDYINTLLKDSSIYVMSSVTESFGIVLLEAMSYGIPCVAFDSAEGANDLIRNNVNGYLIENRNKEEMANKIIELINDKDKRIEMGNQGRMTSLKYTPDIIKKDWMRILKKRG
ncbi:MAG: glycosyltransferase [Bacilli bacterium]